MAQFPKLNHGTLTDPGAGSKLNIEAVQPDSGETKFTVANINTNVKIGHEYSADNFATIAYSEIDTVTANGDHVMPVRVSYPFARPVFSAETGGTAASVAMTTILTN